LYRYVYNQKMYLPARYANLVDEDDEINTNNEIEAITSKKQVMTVPFYFIDKDPETGKRRSTPITDDDLDISMAQSIEIFEKIGCVRLDNMYLVEIISSRGSINEYSVRTTGIHRIAPIMKDYLNKSHLNITRQSRICESI
jgi:hypothetical protein